MKNYDVFKGRPTFTRPPKDGSLPLSLLFDYHGTNSPNHPVFQYEQNGSLKTIYWKEATAAIRSVAALVREKVPQEAGSIPVVAVLAHVDSMTYFTTVAGIMRAGYHPFPISSRNSPAAIAYLLQKTNVKHILVNKDGPMKGLVNAALQESGLETKVLDMPRFDDLYGSDKIVDLPLLEGITLDSVAVVLHSSGSTAFPKPITLTMRMIMETAMSPYYGEIDVGSQVLSAHSVPMFHLMGVIQIAWTSILGLTLGVFPPTSPPVIPTPESVFSSAIASKCTLFYCVPSFLEALAQSPEKVKALSEFLAVLYAGGPLETSTGDMLVEAGVRIAPLYGQTESGTISWSFPSKPDPLGWQWMRLSDHLDPVWVPFEGLENVYKLVLKQKSPIHTPAILNTVVDGVPALDTFDLVERHPKDPNLFQIYGRADDQIMHSTGEKTNPVPIEAILAKDPNVLAAIMFGRSKFHAGIIVLPSPNHVFDPSDTDKLAEYRTLVWPTVEQANEFAPAHSRIFKEMILVADPKKPFEMTPKGTPRRNAVLRDYAEEIESAYGAFDESSQVQFPPPKSWSTEDCISFIHSAIKSIMTDVELGNDDDIFQKGCDSLQVTWIKNTVLHALKSNDKVDIRALPHNFVYAYPTPRKLGVYISNLAEGKSSDGMDTESRIRQMEALSQKYSTNFPRHDNTTNEAATGTSEVVLITGTTGYLGSHILAHLLDSDSFAKVYALNRASSNGLAAKQEMSFIERGFDTALLRSSKLVMLESDLGKEFLGLSRDMYNTIQTEVTLIVHNAWRVDFNVSLPSLEPHLQGTRNLVDLALSRHGPVPRIIFISSIAVFTIDWKNGKVGPEDYLADAQSATGTGYGESKWCAETILHQASLQTPLKPIIVRVGQLAGGPNGEWNTKEWFPALVRSGQTLKQLPSLAGHISWLPINLAARAITELRNSKSQYVNLVNPHPIPVSVVLQPIASLVGAELVPYSQWVGALNESSTDVPDLAINPALALLEFFQSHAGSADKADAEVFGAVPLSSRHAAEGSEALRNLSRQQIDSKDAERWVAYWRKIGFLNN
ncbi:acetyl-CoA synthetase-like protein [Dendrothele bispora CBS 962.96]|uniref:Acetyl-CoA synthetase-like protein n=1 Tax=Dendrothele bispora (strain CBS 962.96) TaxID=1314807 RepID=A0A4S8MA50_DENBC|nr:acetyl-CoA synthetase-like protein [Dendrothele bispora CBS 962.96]